MKFRQFVLRPFLKNQWFVLIVQFEICFQLVQQSNSMECLSIFISKKFYSLGDISSSLICETEEVPLIGEFHFLKVLVQD
jgi:hypothetical protein